MNRFRSTILPLLAGCLLLSARSAWASPARELNWILHLPSLNVTASEHHGDHAQATAAISTYPGTAMDSLRRGLAAHGWTVTGNTTTHAGPVEVWTLEASKRRMQLKATIQNMVYQGALAIDIQGPDEGHGPPAAAAPAPPSHPRVFNANGATGTYACDGDVTVNGNGIQVELTGRVTSLVVNGNGNSIGCSAPVRQIVVNGRDNAVYWARGHRRDVPSVTDNGQNNKISGR